MMKEDYTESITRVKRLVMFKTIIGFAAHGQTVEL